MKALSTIREEHQAIASMLQGLSALVHGIRDYRMAPNFELLRAMLYYVQSFPQRLHHPKEERWLFRLLAARHPPAQALVDRLADQHRVGNEQVARLAAALRQCEETGLSAFPAFADAVDAFVAFERDHIACEEREAFPLAQQHLTGDDWEAIDEAFAAEAHPLAGVATGDGFAELHRRITRLHGRAGAESPGNP